MKAFVKMDCRLGTGGKMSYLFNKTVKDIELEYGFELYLETKYELLLGKEVDATKLAESSTRF